MWVWRVRGSCTLEQGFCDIKGPHSGKGVNWVHSHALGYSSPRFSSLSMAGSGS